MGGLLSGLWQFLPAASLRAVRISIVAFVITQPNGEAIYQLNHSVEMIFFITEKLRRPRT
jgi:hypothetical protein